MAKIRRPKMLHISRLFPNMLTLLGLCAGLSAVRFALAQKWEVALAFVLLGALLDGIDGKVARMMRSQSNFGAQLDSLCDTVNFGVTPALVIFLWQIQEVKRFGWACVLFFVICCVLRLARFNTQMDSGRKPLGERFFQGIPSPAAAILCLSPLMLFLWNQENTNILWLSRFLSEPLFLCAHMLAVGLLMISNIPAFSLRKLVFSPKLGRFILLAAGILFILLISEPWLVIPLVAYGYLLSMPFSTALSKRRN